jgi:hypothetical protein
MHGAAGWKLILQGIGVFWLCATQNLPAVSAKEGKSGSAFSVYEITSNLRVEQRLWTTHVRRLESSNLTRANSILHGALELFPRHYIFFVFIFAVGDGKGINWC